MTSGIKGNFFVPLGQDRLILAQAGLSVYFVPVYQRKLVTHFYKRFRLRPTSPARSYPATMIVRRGERACGERELVPLLLFHLRGSRTVTIDPLCYCSFLIRLVSVGLMKRAGVPNITQL